MPEPHKFEINRNNSGIVLATEGKLCDRNIAVDVSIDETPIIERGIAMGIVRGEKTAYDTFWDAFQRNGSRRDYKHAFRLWGDTVYNPKYPVVMAGDGSYAFQDSTIVKRIDVDTSKCANLQGIFVGASKVTEIGIIDTTGSAGYLAGFFNGCEALMKLEKLILLDDGSQTFSATFFNLCYALKDIEIVGTIGNNLDMQYCRSFSKASVESIVKALSGTVSGKTITLSAEVKSKFTDEQWATLIATKSNWTISLV